MRAVQRALLTTSIAFFGLLGFFWILGGLVALITQQKGVWSIVVGLGFLGAGSLSVVAAVAALQKKAWGRIVLLLIGVINALWWTIVGLVPSLLALLKLRAPLPEEAETPTGPFAILAVLSILFLIFLALWTRPMNNKE